MKTLKQIVEKIQGKELNYSEKLIFLINQTYKFYSKKHKEKIGNSVDFHFSFYAKASTLSALKPVITEQRIDNAFKKCVREMKRSGQDLELALYGIE